MPFNPEDFLNETVPGDLSTEAIILHAGSHDLMISNIVFAVVGETERPILRVSLRSTDPKLEDAMPATLTIWLALTEAGKIDETPGKNIGLARLLKAANNGKEKSMPINKCLHSVVHCIVEHDTYEDVTRAIVKKVIGIQSKR